MRVAGELHDEVIPLLFRVSLLCQVAKRSYLAPGRPGELLANLDELGEAAYHASTEMRGLIHGLRESPIGTRGFAAAIEQFLADLRVQSEAEFVATIPDTIDVLPMDLQLAIYQVVREALTNAARHSRAEKVSVVATVEAGSVFVEIADDGVGFNPWTSRANHFGILIMQDRAASAGGDVYVDSVFGSGSRVCAHFPRTENA